MLLCSDRVSARVFMSVLQIDIDRGSPWRCQCQGERVRMSTAWSVQCASVQVEDDVSEMGWCMVVFQGKLNKVVVYATIGNGDVKPTVGNRLVLGPCLV